VLLLLQALSISRSVCWLVGWLVSWLVGWLVGWLAGWLAGHCCGADNRVLVVVIVLWSTTGECMNITVLKGHKNAVLDLQWTNDGKYVSLQSYQPPEQQHYECEYMDDGL
jgi:hypothetical protein